MEIYRAVLKYNNADICEWERWYERCSVWYSKRELAEQHLPLLNDYLNHLKNNVFTTYREDFEYKGPFIETKIINNEFVPMDIKFDSEYYDV